MSTLILTLREALPARLDLSPLLPALAEGGVSAVSHLPLSLGNQKLPLGELFSVQGNDPADVVLQGDLMRGDGIGAGLQSGSLRVEGNAGAYLGRNMSGGLLHVQGHAGAYAGAEMRQGRLQIEGNAGDYLGAALPGAMKGMAGGQIVVHGDVGERCADRMRRGAILVAGQLGAYAGARMLAGTVLALQGAGAHAGYGMRRGTLLLRGPCRLDATFADCGTHTLPIVHLLFRSWAALGGAFVNLADTPHPVHRFVGDRACDGKGEVLRFS